MKWCCFKNSTLKIHILACEERESHLKVENEKFLLFFLVQFPHQLFFLPTGNNVNNFAGSLLSVSSWSLTFYSFLFSCSFIMKYHLFKMNTHWRWNMAANRWKDRRRLVGLISICCEYGMRWILRGRNKEANGLISCLRCVCECVSHWVTHLSIITSPIRSFGLKFICSGDRLRFGTVCGKAVRIALNIRQISLDSLSSDTHTHAHISHMFLGERRGGSVNMTDEPAPHSSKHESSSIVLFASHLEWQWIGCTAVMLSRQWWQFSSRFFICRCCCSIIWILSFTEISTLSKNTIRMGVECEAELTWPAIIK